jgi:hypothetical protein
MLDEIEQDERREKGYDQAERERSAEYAGQIRQKKSDQAQRHYMDSYAGVA